MLVLAVNDTHMDYSYKPKYLRKWRKEGIKFCGLQITHENCENLNTLKIYTHMV